MKVPAKIYILFLSLTVFVIFSDRASAMTYTSQGYILRNARIVFAGGKSTSLNYLLGNVNIGNAFGGKAESANFSLDLSGAGLTANKPVPPNPPTLNPVTTPTNVNSQLLTGTKDTGTSIYINGYEAVPVDNNTAWSYTQPLVEGENILFITSRNATGMESSPVSTTIFLDTILPSINSVLPADGSLFEIGALISFNITAMDPGSDILYYRISIDGTIVMDWTLTSNFSWDTLQKSSGIHNIIVYVKDRAANERSQSLQLYLVRRAVDLP